MAGESMAWRTEAMSEVTPVEVSSCTTHTALISCSATLRSRASIRSACTRRRQLRLLMIACQRHHKQFLSTFPVAWRCLCALASMMRSQVVIRFLGEVRAALRSRRIEETKLQPPSIEVGNSTPHLLPNSSTIAN